MPWRRGLFLELDKAINLLFILSNEQPLSETSVALRTLFEYIQDIEQELYELQEPFNPPILPDVN